MFIKDPYLMATISPWTKQFNIRQLLIFDSKIQWLEN